MVMVRNAASLVEHQFETLPHPFGMMGDMDLAAVVEQVQHVAAVRADAAAECEHLESALRGIGRLQAWLAGNKAAITSKLAAQVSFPEQTVADCTRESTRDVINDRARADTLDAVPSFAHALDDAAITAGHVDALTNAVNGLDNDAQRTELRERAAGLVGVAANATVEQFRRRLGVEAKNIRRDDGIERLERQRRDTQLRTWVDGEGMVCLSGRFDPVTGRALTARLDNIVQALFAESTPDTCPTDPIRKQHHLQALALARIVDGHTNTVSGRPEYVVVIDTSQPDGAGGPVVDWGIPVEVPHRVLAELIADGDTHTVVVRKGVVLHAPGRLDLGRSTRLANRAQRRALRALYATCAIPGCSVSYDRCKIHHITWWRRGGRTDLHNLVPACAHHHTKIHDDGWLIELGANRELTIRFPDGTIRNTGPPSRRAA
jgi:hypothetical protein